LPSHGVVLQTSEMAIPSRVVVIQVLLHLRLAPPDLSDSALTHASPSPSTLIGERELDEQRIASARRFPLRV
jgi:hypothetical protein